MFFQRKICGPPFSCLTRCCLGTALLEATSSTFVISGELVLTGPNEPWISNNYLRPTMRGNFSNALQFFIQILHLLSTFFFKLVSHENRFEKFSDLDFVACCRYECFYLWGLHKSLVASCFHSLKLRSLSWMYVQLELYDGYTLKRKEHRIADLGQRLY